MAEYNSQELNENEKILVAKQIFKQQKTEDKFIKNIGTYISNNFAKIDGFDSRWSSLITSNPLLFEDMDYVRVRSYVNNSITEEEIQAYKSGELRELYGTIENMIVCNLEYYDRIMSFCTMIFLHYVRIGDDLYSEHLDDVPYMFEMTPTQIWCAALSNNNSSEWELNYAWSVNNNRKIVKIRDENSCKSSLELNYNELYKQSKSFAKFNEYNAIRCGTTGFRNTLISDKTSNRKLSQVCAKFSKTSTAITDEQLSSLYKYVGEHEKITKQLYDSLDDCLFKIFNGDKSHYAIYIYSTEFFIHTSKFSIRVGKDKKGLITKDYLANSYECFAAEEYLLPSIRHQIQWAKYQMPQHFDYDKSILNSLLSEMLRESYRDILCIKRMNEYGVVSKITFSGIFGNVYINEDLMFDNRCIKSSKKCLSKINAAKYVIDKGYYIFGIEEDVYKMLDVTRKSLVEHYKNYCVPVIKHMFDIITTHIMSKNDIIDVACSGTLNPNKLNNANIRYTNIKNVNNTDSLIKDALNKINNTRDKRKKSYWTVIKDDDE